MILAVCLNPAVDVTYRAERLVAGTSHRVESVVERAGGKGVNVVRIVTALGEPAKLCGLLGESDPALWAGVDATAGWTRVAGRARRSVAVVTADGATLFNEPGPLVSGSEWARFVTDYSSGLDGVAVVVLSGSVPPGAPVDAYAQLIEIAHRRGAQVVLDASGVHLQEGLAARPEVAKPNRHELAEVFGAEAGPEALLAAGARAAVVSAGADGLIATDGCQCWTAGSTAAVAGNPTGAGDALAAALAIGLARHTPWPEALREGVAVAAAAVAAPVAGELDPTVLAAQRLAARVGEV